jgi:hypothetical protein
MGALKKQKLALGGIGHGGNLIWALKTVNPFDGQK